MRSDRRRWKLRRQQKLTILLKKDNVEAQCVERTPEIPCSLDLSVILMVFKQNWSKWLQHITHARLAQISLLSSQPSVTNIELLMDLEFLGSQMEQVRAHMRVHVCRLTILI